MKKAKSIFKFGFLTILAGIPGWYVNPLIGGVMMIIGAIIDTIAACMIIAAERDAEDEENWKLFN